LDAFLGLHVFDDEYEEGEEKENKLIINNIYLI